MRKLSLLSCCAFLFHAALAIAQPATPPSASFPGAVGWAAVDRIGALLNAARGAAVPVFLVVPSGK